MMRIVVTGARGRLGGPTVAYCQRMGAEVLAVDALGGPAEYSQFLRADLTQPDEVYDVVTGADAVIHLAAIAAQRVYPSRHTFFTNVGMTWNILEASARLGVKRVVMASSLQVNHTVTPRTPIKYEYFPIDEQHPVSPQDDYGLSKLVGEMCARTFSEHWGLTALSLRFPYIADEAEFARLPFERIDQPWVALFAYIHLQDAARACYLAATADLPPKTHQTLLVAARDTTAPVPTREYIRQFFPEAEVRPGLAEYGSLMDCGLAERLIGFVPEFSLERTGAM
jgi:nucleoside-diphosphate-sugar epimerase